MGNVLRVDDPSQLPPHLRAQVERAMNLLPAVAEQVQRLRKPHPLLPAPAPAEPPPKPKKRRGDPEHQQQKILMTRLKALAENLPRYAMAWKRTYATPNAGNRRKGAAGRLKAEGMKPGISDLFVAFPVGRFHGCYIEMKRIDGGKLSREQDVWIRDSLALGYMAACCHGADEAQAVWRDYVDGKLE